MKVALWYWRHGSPGYELCDSERQAARSAVHMSDSGDAAAVGVQFPDGRLVKVDDWQTYKEVDEEMFQKSMKQIRTEQQKPRRPTRRIREPFSGRELSVYADEAPDWLGVSDV